MTNTLNKIIHNGDEYMLPRQKALVITLTSAGWTNNEQTVTATGVTASNSIIISPVPTDISDYTDAKIYCSAQGTDSLTFTCDTTPASDIEVNVLVLSAEIGSGPTPPSPWQPGVNTIARWKLDGDTTDSVNNVYDMTARVGSMSYGTLGDGTTKYGIFNGSTVLVASSVPTWTKGTLSVWINKSSTAEGIILGQCTDTYGSDAYVTSIVKQNQLTFWIPGGPDKSWSYTMPLNTWLHIVFTQDGTNLSVYADGVQIGTEVNSSWFNYNNGNILCIGGQARSTQSYGKLTGNLSNVIIESEAWSLSDIQNYYNQTKSLYGIS